MVNSSTFREQVKNRMQTPEFPPKKVMKWNHKVLEQRRAALEVYLQVKHATKSGCFQRMKNQVINSSCCRSLFTFPVFQMQKFECFRGF